MKESRSWAAAILAAVSVLGFDLEQARAQDPFRPVPTAPICSKSINRGAQQALDAFMAEVKEQQRIKQHDLKQRIYKEDYAGNDTYGLELEKKILDIKQRHEAKNALAVKATEMWSFALKKYKCEVQIFYYVP